MAKNDNRNYKFQTNSTSNRDEYAIIANWIPKGSSVIDLGSGDGSLLALLKAKGADGEGVEIAESGVEATKKKGIKATVGQIDVKHPYNDKQFDFAVCNVTIQMVMYPEVLIKEMHRIAKKQIISFPNFAFLPNRLDLLLHGRMPQVMIPGYEWFSTGHIHQLSLNDFKTFCQQQKISIIGSGHIGPNMLHLSFLEIPHFILKRYPNVFASTAIYLTE